MAIGLQIIFAMSVFYYFACIASLAIGGFLFACSSIKDMKRNLRELDEMAKNGQSEAEIVTKSTEFVSFHSRVKQLSRTFSIRNTK